MNGTDHDPCKGLREGRDDAWAALYDRAAARLFRVAWGLLGQREEAEDAVQEVFVGLARARNTLGEIRNLDAYLFAALRRACAHVHEQRARKRTVESARTVERDAREADAPDPEIQAALSRLPLDQREVLLLKIDGGLTFAEIAETLEISPGTASSRYRYALEKLRGALEVRSRG